DDLTAFDEAFRHSGTGISRVYQDIGRAVVIQNPLVECSDQVGATGIHLHGAGSLAALLHIAFSSRETANEAFAGEDAIHVILQRSGLAWQLDAEHRQTPENRRQTAINQTELLAHEEGHFGEYRCDADQALAQFLACL